MSDDQVLPGGGSTLENIICRGESCSDSSHGDSGIASLDGVDCGRFPVFAPMRLDLFDNLIGCTAGIAVCVAKASNDEDQGGRGQEGLPQIIHSASLAAPEA
jgi:hypothetical protein